MEDEIFPWLSETGSTHALSVGCLFYTRHYPALLRPRGIRLTTIDIDPGCARFGAQTHYTCSVTEVDPALFGRLFDAVLFNGVVGHGLDTEAEVAAGLRALRSVMQDGAPMVIGWNSDRMEPAKDAILGAGFEPSPGPTGQMQVAFHDVSHVYDFVRAA